MPRRQRKRKQEDICVVPKQEDERRVKEEPVGGDVRDDPVYRFESHTAFFRDETQGLIERMDRLETIELKLVGVTHYQRELARVRSRTTVVLERNPDNKYDKHAIAIKTLGGDQLGSIARTENRSTHPGRFYCPRLLASCNINYWVNDSVITHGGDCEDPNRYYGTVECRASTKTMSVGSVAALPFDLPLDLIDRARTLTDRLDAAGHPQWVERKVKLLAASTKSAAHLNDDDGDVPRCCISGLPTENLEPMWILSDKNKTCTLDHFVVVHKAMRDVLYVNPSEPEDEAVARLVLLNDKKLAGLTERECRFIYRQTLDRCRARDQRGWTLTCPEQNEFADPLLTEY